MLRAGAGTAAAFGLPLYSSSYSDCPQRGHLHMRTLTLRGEETLPVPLGGEGEAASKPHSPGSNSRILALTDGLPKGSHVPCHS